MKRKCVWELTGSRSAYVGMIRFAGAGSPKQCKIFIVFLTVEHQPDRDDSGFAW